MRSSALLMTMAFFILLTFTGCATRTVGQRSVSEALGRDAEAYAKAQDVTLDEAIRRLTLQDPVGELNAVLQEQEPDVFAGLWIEHEPEYKVVVRITRDERRIWHRYIRGGPLEDQVEMRRAAVSWEELQAAESRAHTSIDPRRSCIVIFASQESLEPRVEAAGERLPAPICFEPSSFPPPPPLDPPPGISFPRRDPPEGMYTEMTALLIGELAEVDGCLRIRAASDDPGVLVIWPYDHTITADEQGVLKVRDGSGHTVAREGDVLQMGGGEVPENALSHFTSMEIPDRCASSYYWIAASGIESAHRDELPMAPAPSP
jgi:hypothetical protein